MGKSSLILFRPAVGDRRPFASCRMAKFPAYENRERILHSMVFNLYPRPGRVIPERFLQVL
jgi:hypothetical protein